MVINSLKLLVTNFYTICRQELVFVLYLVHARFVSKAMGGYMRMLCQPAAKLQMKMTTVAGTKTAFNNPLFVKASLLSACLIVNS